MTFLKRFKDCGETSALSSAFLNKTTLMAQERAQSTASDSPSLYAVHRKAGTLSLVMDGSRDEQVRNKIMTSGDGEVMLVHQ